MMSINIADSEVELTAVRSQGAGGQHVNKVSSAIHLRFYIPTSSLPADVKVRLLALKDHRITRDGAIIIKAQNYRSQELNRNHAFERLHELINRVAHPPKHRLETKPTYSSKQKRLAGKRRHAEIKAFRAKSLY